METTEEQNPQLARLLKQRDQLNARIRDAQARDRKQKRKEETRRKIITGAIAITHMDMHPASDFAKELHSLLHQHVSKPQERELLGLSPLAKTFNSLDDL